MTEGTDAKMGASEELKRLGFLYEYGNLAADLGTKYYEIVKKQAPSTLSPGIETLEGAIKAYGAPIVSKVQDVAPKVITEADKRVDGVVERVNTVYTTSRGVVDKYTSSENIKAFKKTREEYLKQIETLLEDLKAKGFQGSVVSQRQGLRATPLKKKPPLSNPLEVDIDRGWLLTTGLWFSSPSLSSHHHHHLLLLLLLKTTTTTTTTRSSSWLGSARLFP